MAKLMERMAFAGWVSRTHVDAGNEAMGIQWTPKGKAALRELSVHFEALGRPLPPPQMICLQFLIDRFFSDPGFPGSDVYPEAPST